MKKHVFIVSLVLLATIAFVGAFDVSVNNYDPTPAEAGKTVNVWFKVENPDLDKVERNVVLELVPQDDLELAPGEDSEKRIGLLQPGSSQIVQFRLLVQDDAFKGAHIVEAKLISDDSSFQKDLTLEVIDKDFKEVDLSIGNIQSDPTRIKPDDENVKLVVTILNLGDGRAQGVRAELVNLPEGIAFSESYSGTALIGNIDADGTAEGTFYIDVDETVAPKEHLAGVKVTYKFKPDEDEEDYTFEEKLLSLRLPIKPVPLYEITSVELEPTNLTAGDRDVKLRLTLKNIGEETGDSVRIKAFGKTEQPFSFDKSSDFVAPSLEPGDSGQATLEFKVDEDANLQTYFLDLEIKNIVDNDIITYNEKVPVTVVYPKADNPFSLVYIGLGIVLVVVVIIVVRGIFRGRKKRKAKKVGGAYGKSYLDKLDKER